MEENDFMNLMNEYFSFREKLMINIKNTNSINSNDCYLINES